MAKQKYWNGTMWEVIGTDAEKVELKDSDNLFNSTNVEDALKELFINVSNGKSLVGGAITDVDPNVVVPTNPTFQQLADAIAQINPGKKFASGTTKLSVPYQTDVIIATGLNFTIGFVLVAYENFSIYMSGMYLDNVWLKSTERYVLDPVLNNNNIVIRSDKGSLANANWNWIAFEK